MTGEFSVGSTLTADPGTWSPEVTSFTYQWVADGVDIPGATAQTFTLASAQAQQRIEVRVTGATADGRSASATSTTGFRVAIIGTPRISGTMAKGSTASATVGTWTYNTAFTYQWLADGEPIAGATAKSFKITSAQSGKKLSIRVTGTKTGYQTIARTSASSTNRVMNWTTPTITGTVAYGSTLTAKRGTWTPYTTFTYRWYANGTAISGATSSTLKLGTAQKDKRITVKVTGRKSGHTTVSKTSAATGKVQTAATPKISGTAVYGATLTAKRGTWTPYTTFTYQWYADGVAIDGATGTTLKLGTAQKNKQIRVKVTGKRSGYATVTKTSAATLRVQTAPTPKVSGTPKVTYTLSVTRGSWSSGTSFTYQWYADGVALSGKTGSTLKVTTGLVGKTIKVKVTGRKSGYPTLSRTSAATARVTYPLRTAPVDTWTCPSWAPIKGNADSMIYHMPGGMYYDRTNPEECFRTEAAAVDAGYRKSKR